MTDKATLETKDKNFLEEKIDEVFREFENAKNISEFISQSKLKAAYFNHKNLHKNLWERPHPCVYPGCSNHSISSHTLQKSGPIDLIAESGHVLTPTFSSKTGTVTLEKIGINEASTFPGFCSKCELKFGEFEKEKTLSKPNHYFLQLFRTICRELIRRKHECDSLKDIAREHQAVNEREFSNRLLQKLGKEFIARTKFSFTSFKLEFKNNLSELFSNEISRVENDCNSFHKYFFEAFQKNSDDFCLTIVRLDYCIPACLAGRGNFHVDDCGKIVKIEVIINILPYGNRTELLILAPLAHKKYLQNYIDHFSYAEIGALTMAESWMIYGSDHWFMMPSVGAKIPKVRKKDFCKAILSTDFNIGERCRFSIFDDLRRNLIEKVQADHDINDQVLKALEFENSKLNKDTVL